MTSCLTRCLHAALQGSVASLAGVDGFAASPHPTACRQPEWGQGRRSVADAKAVWQPGGHGQTLSHMAGTVGGRGPHWKPRGRRCRGKPKPFPKSRWKSRDPTAWPGAMGPSRACCLAAGALGQMQKGGVSVAYPNLAYPIPRYKWQHERKVECNREGGHTWWQQQGMSAQQGLRRH